MMGVNDGLVLAWCDLETSGLNVYGPKAKDQILEFAMQFTDADFNDIGEAYQYVIAPTVHPRTLITDDYVWDMHTENGLLSDLSTGGVPAWWADQLMSVVMKSLPTSKKIWLAGTGVAQFDIHAIRAHMPMVAEMLDYRTLDVGHMRRMFQVMGYDMGGAGATAHRALPDMVFALESAREFRSFIKPMMEVAE